MVGVLSPEFFSESSAPRFDYRTEADIYGDDEHRIHCFENVTAIVFLVAISEYDQMLYEDGQSRSFLPPLYLLASPADPVTLSLSLSPSITNRIHQPHARGAGLVRFHLQLALVREDEYHPLPEQGSSSCPPHPASILPANSSLLLVRLVSALEI